MCFGLKFKREREASDLKRPVMISQTDSRTNCKLSTVQIMKWSSDLNTFLPLSTLSNYSIQIDGAI